MIFFVMQSNLRKSMSIFDLVFMLVVPATVHLVDSQGRAYDPSSVGQKAHEVQNGAARPLGDLLSPGSSFTTVRVFDLPLEAKEVGLVVVHGSWPGWFIIGDSQSLLHKRITIKLMVS
jgi:hypothetical protein